MNKLRLNDVNQAIMEEFHTNIIKSKVLNNFRECRKNIVRSQLSRSKSIKVPVNDEYTLINNLDYFNTNSQHMINNLLNNQILSRKIIKSFGMKKKIRYPIPFNWTKFFKEKGFKTDILSCFILWNLYLFKYFISNYISLVLILMRDLKFLNSKTSMRTEELLSPYVYIHDYEQNFAGDYFYVFANWCRSTKELRNTNYYHSNPKFMNSRNVLFNENIFLPKNNRNLFSSFIKAIHVYHKIMLNYGVKNIVFVPLKDIYIAFNLASKKDLNRNEYLFLDSNRLRKPLWVNYLEQVNSRVVYVETSQSIEPQDLHGNELHDDFEELVEWNEIWTVSKERMKYLTSLNKQKMFKVKNLGLPWVTDSEFNLGSINKPIISVFDVEPHRYYFGWSTYNVYGLQKIQFAAKFLADIMSVAMELDLYVLHKPKRNIGEKRYPEYAQLISNFKENFSNNYCLLDPNVSPQKIIQTSAFSIATPFTSALLANPEAECARIYFDPLFTGINTSIDSGFELVLGKHALKNFINLKLGI